jgi:hypothetical protein
MTTQTPARKLLEAVVRGTQWPKFNIDRKAVAAVSPTPNTKVDIVMISMVVTARKHTGLIAAWPVQSIAFEVYLGNLTVEHTFDSTTI